MLDGSLDSPNSPLFPEKEEGLKQRTSNLPRATLVPAEQGHELSQESSPGALLQDRGKGTTR